MTRPLTSVEELCTIPTWPVIYAPGLPQGGIYAGSNPRLTDEETREFWRPKCVDRTDFDREVGGRGSLISSFLMFRRISV